MVIPRYNLGLIAQIVRGTDWDEKFTLYEPDATSNAADFAGVLANEDTVRFRLWDSSAALALSFTDDAASAGGSTIQVVTRGVTDTTPAAATVKLAGDDTNLAPGFYQGEVAIEDASDLDSEGEARWHVACIFQIEILAAPV